MPEHVDVAIGMAHVHILASLVLVENGPKVLQMLQKRTEEVICMGATTYTGFTV